MHFEVIRNPGPSTREVIGGGGGGGGSGDKRTFLFPSDIYLGTGLLCISQV